MPKKDKKEEKKRVIGDPFWKDDFPTLKITRDTSILPAQVEQLDLIRNTLTNLWSLNRDPGRAHYASEAFGCPRKVVLRRKGAFPTDPETFGAMDTGNIVEERVIATYKNAGAAVPFSEQVYVTVEHPDLKLPIHGKIDLMVVEGGSFVPVEIKSAKDFDEMLGGWDGWLKWKPSMGHVAQLMVYLKYMQDFFAPYVGKVMKPPTYGYVHYYNKNRELHARFKVEYDENFFNHICGYFKVVERFMEADQIPTLAEAGDTMMAFKAKGKSLSPDTFPCSWEAKGKAKKDLIATEGSATVGKCEFHSGCWGCPVGEKAPKFIFAKDVKAGDLDDVIDAIAGRSVE